MWSCYPAHREGRNSRRSIVSVPFRKDPVYVLPGKQLKEGHDQAAHVCMCIYMLAIS